MTHTLLWHPEADSVMTAIEGNPGRTDLVASIRRALGRLELDPHNPRIGTRQFQTPEYGQIRATPTGYDTWYVLWLAVPSKRSIEIVHIVELRM